MFRWLLCFLDLYEHFLTALSAVIEGTMESSKYEDECRQLMGSASYQSFTMDKLVIQTVRQLQAMVLDATAIKLRVRLDARLWMFVGWSSQSIAVTYYFAPLSSCMTPHRVCSHTRCSVQSCCEQHSLPLNCLKLWRR